MDETRPDTDETPLSRRDALGKSLRLLGAGAAGLALAGCAASSTRQSSCRPMSEAERARLREPIDIRPYEPAREGSTHIAGGHGIASAIPRHAWTAAPVVPALMNRMRPIDKVTIHHDGMTPYTATSEGAARDRLELIRASHRSRNWGDVGYHFLIDPSGRVWAGRPLDWQGAHVGGQNEGNIGICVMGNYERQRPNRVQLASVERSVAELMRRYNIPLDSVHTHKELAPTACPGRNLQPRLESMRSRRGPLARV